VEDEGLVSLSQGLGLLFLGPRLRRYLAPLCSPSSFSPPYSALSTPFQADCVPLRWDGVSPAGPSRSALSALLIIGGLLLILPRPMYDWLQAAGLAPFAEAYYSLFLPTR